MFNTVMKNLQFVDRTEYKSTYKGTKDESLTSNKIFGGRSSFKYY